MKQSVRNIAFLVELIINVLIFSITCAILVGLFGKASQLARNTREENFATSTIYAMFETVRAEGAVAIEDGFEEDGRWVYYFDKDWNHTEVDHAAQYTIAYTLSQSTGGTDTAGELTALEATAQDREGREICSMETAVYQPE